ncbi:MAG: FtsX-like permease family protein [Actinobacteria bacterium]|nr:FtsX-like permease family protein [Actinomycetota bacterium]
MPRHYEFFLICRYLRKKRLAIFSIVAVALSVAMLIVVTSVMGGFVRQYRQACHGFYGDIIVRADSLMGFPYYEDLIAQAEQLPDVKVATPVIKQFSLLRIDQPGFKLFVRVVSVLGIEPNGYSKITNFKQSLWKQSLLPGPPTLDLPEGFADDPKYRDSGACIVGVEVPYNRQPDGSYKRYPQLYDSPVILTILPLKRTGMIDTDVRVSHPFLLIDDSETSIFSELPPVYIRFDIAQNMSRMYAYRDIDGNEEPAKTSQVQIRVRDGADVERVRRQLQDIWQKIITVKGDPETVMVFETWDEQEGIAPLINQLEHDRALLTILFVIMGVVSIFLIFCIFFVIVTEKIPDIGIIKSVGASSAGVGRIFLAYAGAIGLLGAILGLAMGWPFVVHINAIHDWIAHTFGWRIYDPNVLVFPYIPNEVDWFAAVIIIASALVGSLIGSMIPAIRAALMKPIKALRYE